MSSRRLIEALLAKQAEAGLDDEQWTASLRERGVRPMGAAYWSHFRRGRRRLTEPLIRHIRRAFPELEAECIAALLTDDRPAAWNPRPKPEREAAVS